MAYIPPSGDNIVFDFPLSEYTPPPGDNVTFPDGSAVFESTGGAISGSPPDPLVSFPLRKSYQTVGGSLSGSPPEPEVRHSVVRRYQASGGAEASGIAEYETITVNKAFEASGGAIVGSPTDAEIFVGFTLEISGEYQKPIGENLQILFGTVVLQEEFYTGESGSVTGGSSTVRAKRSVVTSDGAICSASAFIRRNASFSATAGAIVEGSGEIEFGYIPRIADFESLGGALSGGSLNHTRKRSVVTTKGSVIGGSVDLLRSQRISTHGGSVVGDSADISATNLQIIDLTSTVEAIAGYSADIQRTTHRYAESGAIAGGLSTHSGINLQIIDFVSSGGAIVAGSSSVVSVNLTKVYLEGIIEVVGGGQSTSKVTCKHEGFTETVAGGSASHFGVNLNLSAYESIGGSVVGGSALFEGINLQIIDHESIGGSVVGGSALFESINLQIIDRESIGGSVVGDSAFVIRQRILDSVGGALSSGLSSSIMLKKVEAVGGSIASGSASLDTVVIQKVSRIAIGGSVAGGRARTNIPLNEKEISEGGILVGGTAIVLRYRPVISEIPVVAGGQSVSHKRSEYLTDSGSLASGTAESTGINLQLRDWLSEGGSVSAGLALPKYFRFTSGNVEAVAGGTSEVVSINLNIVHLEGDGGAVVNGQTRIYVPTIIRLLSEVGAIGGGVSGHRIPPPLLRRYVTGSGGAEVGIFSSSYKSREIHSIIETIGGGSFSYRIIAWGSGHYDVSVDYDQWQVGLTPLEYEGNLISQEIYTECLYGNEINLESVEMKKSFLVERDNQELQCEMAAFIAMTELEFGSETMMNSKDTEVEIKLWPQMP